MKNYDKPKALKTALSKALRCPNNLNGSDLHYCHKCDGRPLKTANVAAQAAEPAGKAALAAHVDTSEYIKLHPDHVARALNIGRIVDAGELLDLLRKLRDGAVTDSNSIGELSSQLDEMTGKYNAALEGKNCEAEHNKELLGQIVNLTDERDKAQEDLRKALAERNQARAAFRALAQRADFDTFCDLLLNWGTDK